MCSSERGIEFVQIIVPNPKNRSLLQLSSSVKPSTTGSGFWTNLLGIGLSPVQPTLSYHARFLFLAFLLFGFLLINVVSVNMLHSFLLTHQRDLQELCMFGTCNVTERALRPLKTIRIDEENEIDD